MNSVETIDDPSIASTPETKGILKRRLDQVSDFFSLFPLCMLACLVTYIVYYTFRS